MSQERDDLSGMRILLVDDVANNIEILFQTLKVRYDQISMASNGVKAIEQVKKWSPDIILMDIMMPEMDGIEACKRLKADESTRDIPILFITAKAATQDVVEGFKAGGADYIAKPFRVEEVLARVEVQLRLRKVMKEKDDLISELRDTRDILLDSARMDLLTGIQNRQGLEENLNKEQSRSQRIGKPFSIILADIDKINKINEDYGMSVGDQVIIRTSSFLTQNIRSHDMVGRWSSEEFLILLPETELAEAKVLAEKIRSMIEDEKLSFNEDQISLTLSMGASHCTTDMKWAECLVKAQDCLRQAKERGRNQLVVGESE